MRRLLPRTFFMQLVLGTVLVQSLFLGGFCTYIVISQHNQAQQRNHDRIAGQLNRLSAACAKQMRRGDAASLSDVLELAEIAPTIEATRLTDLSGKTLAVSRMGRERDLDAAERKVLPTATRQQIFTSADGQLEAVTPVLRDGTPVALLWLEPNPSLSFSTAGTIVRMAFTYGAAALLFNLLPIFLLVRTMTRPLRRLNEATSRLIHGPDAGIRFPLPVTSSNEAGTLTASFNTMVLELEEQRSGLLETLALLDSMLENAPIGFAFFDREKRYVKVNGFLSRMQQRAAEDLIGQRATEVHAGDLALGMEEYLGRVFAEGEAIRDVELTGEASLTSSFRRTWLLHFYPVRTRGNAVRWVGVIVVEITDRLQAEEKLRQTEKLAATGRLAASVAHEINNPLEAVTNLLFILEHHQPIDEQTLGFVRSAQAELARVAHITQQTLRFYRQSVSRSLTNLPEVLDQIVQLYQPRMKAANIAVRKSYRDNAELVCFGGELRQTFANLIVNAIDAMPRGGTLTLRVRRGTSTAADGRLRTGVCVCVADTGSGMSRATQRRIFEAFFTTKDATGTGLGLWVSEEIVRKHEGTIQVRSRQGAHSGTCFRIFLPEYQVEESVSPSSTVLAGEESSQKSLGEFVAGQW